MSQCVICHGPTNGHVTEDLSLCRSCDRAAKASPSDLSCDDCGQTFEGCQEHVTSRDEDVTTYGIYYAGALVGRRAIGPGVDLGQRTQCEGCRRNGGPVHADE